MPGSDIASVIPSINGSQINVAVKNSRRPGAVITGASRGIGAAIALALAEDGYDVVISYLSRESEATEIARTCESRGVRAVAVCADAGTAEGLKVLFHAVDEHLGSLHLLVNNAAVLPIASTVDGLDYERVMGVMSTNSVGPLLHAREAVRRMTTQLGGAGGVIINISSRAAERGAAGEFLDYAMSKAAIDIMTIGLAQEVAGQGIRVVGVRPGLIDTDMNAGQPGRLARLISTVPLGRVGTAEEVAETVRWLASSKASYITGVTLDVSGGR